MAARPLKGADWIMWQMELSCLKGLSTLAVFPPHLHFLFSPLLPDSLYSVEGLSPSDVGRGPAGSAEELQMEVEEDPLMGPTTPDPSLFPGQPLAFFLVWADAILDSCVGRDLECGTPAPSSLKSLHSHGDALHLFPRDRLDPETLDPGHPLE
ncbi:uncharacterized protein LOC108304069 isoform X2 [Cebus imitator]|uniref:uncharacterized protein LOC108304069 isoform X2 n=1 Tax=Cebus imitator TaxID=2715852 RepID=UPI00080A14F6|nr:uncharacterized protein LOC108304069 isoform X2 [Cebus imitator]